MEESLKDFVVRLNKDYGFTFSALWQNCIKYDGNVTSPDYQKFWNYIKSTVPNKEDRERLKTINDLGTYMKQYNVNE